MTEPETNTFAVLIERRLSENTYGAGIEMTTPTGLTQARAEFAAILAGQRSKLCAVPPKARVVQFGTSELDSAGVIISHRVRGDELTRVSVVRVLR